MWAWGSGRARGLAEATMPPNETANRKEQAREWEKNMAITIKAQQ